MRDKDCADDPDNATAEYSASQSGWRSIGTCRTCAHNGCCDTYCGGCYWTPEEPEEPEDDPDEEDE